MPASLPAHLKGLLSRQAYPHAVSRIECVETHMSWVFLTGDYAYKIKRPVRYPFADLRSAERRAHFCHEEVRLNRRFAPELYLDVVKVVQVDGRTRIRSTGEAVEHAVRMRQFPSEEQLDVLLADSLVEPEELAAFGRDLATIHSGLPQSEPEQPYGSFESVQGILLSNLDECSQVAETFRARSRLELLRAPLASRLAACRKVIESRRKRGLVRECHGDLHSRNVARYAGRLVAFDCVEFEPAFRWIDVADEISFLVADLEAAGHSGHANAFLNGYLSASGDYEACRLIPLYGTHRALVRAKVAALTAGNGGQTAALQHQFDRYLEYAQRSFARPRPTLLLMSGLSGSGKTWLAQRLAPALGAVHIRSDVERKRLAGLSEQASSASPPGEKLYSPEWSTRTYAHLARLAEDVLAAGFTAIVDASFLRRADRAVFREVSERWGAPLKLIHCDARADVLRARIERRWKQRSDASEADLAVLRWQQQTAEKLQREEGLEVIEVDTSGPEPTPSRTELVGRLRTPA